MKHLYLNEWKGFVRNKLIRSLLSIFILSLILVTWFGIHQNNVQIEKQVKRKN